MTNRPFRSSRGESRASSSTSSSAADRDTLLGLARDADVLIETFRPGVADRLGLGFERLAADNPRLVYASITGFGRTGPYAAVKGYEGLVMAKLGVNAAFRAMTRGSRPPFVDAPWCSFSASQTALHGILAALYERERSGLGQRVEANLVQGFAALDTWAWFLHLIAERWPDAYEAVAVFDDDGVPASPFPYMLLNPLTKDGRWLQFAQVRPHLFVALDAGARPRVDADRPALGRHSGVRGRRTPPRALGEDARGRGREDARRVGGDLRRRSRRLRRAVPPRSRGPRPSPAGPRRSGRRDRRSPASGSVRQPGPLVQMDAHTRLGRAVPPRVSASTSRGPRVDRRSAPPVLVVGDAAPATFRLPGSRCSSWRSCTPHHSARRCSPTSGPG